VGAAGLEDRSAPSFGSAIRIDQRQANRPHPRQIDATILSYPEIYIAKKRGMNVLADIGDFDDYPNTAVIVTRAFVETQRSLAKNLLKSEIESIHHIRTNKPGSLKILKNI
jgi:ABC-type nitrate/sulfonate/bicarbonate transport system substrate-binding protein